MSSDYYHVADRQTRLRSAAHSIGIVVGAFLAGYALAFLVGQLLILSGVVEPGIEDVPPVPLTLLTIAQFVGFGVAIYAYLTMHDERDLLSFKRPSPIDIAWIVGGFVALVVIGIVVSAIIQFLEADTATNQVVDLGRQNPTLFLYMIPVTIFFVAPAEELLFRGVVQGLFRRAYGVVPGIVLASLLFGVGHYLALSGGGKLSYIAVTVSLGLVLGTLYELTENLTIPIGVHALWNAVIFVTQYLNAVGYAGT